MDCAWVYKFDFKSGNQGRRIGIEKKLSPGAASMNALAASGDNDNDVTPAAVTATVAAAALLLLSRNDRRLC